MHRLALALLMLMTFAAAAPAQQPKPASPGQSAPGQPPKQGAGPARTGDCGLLPGGKAPVAHIAELATPLSPRSLDLVYFGKRLADLTHADFERIAEINQRCPPGDGILAEDKLAKLEDVVREAQKARNQTISWAKRRMAEVQALPPGRDRLVRLNELWSELPSQEGAMTREDIDSFAAWIAHEQQVLYDATLRPRQPAPPPASGQAGGASAPPHAPAPAP